jgi:hypothetical protein
MNFLQLCQAVAQESGTISGTLPATVLAQTGRLLKIVTWTAEAWNQIQGEHGTWKWMRGEWDGEVLANTVRYTPASFDLTRHRDWITDKTNSMGAVTIYKTSTGVSDEYPIPEIDWEDFRARYLRGTQTANRPVAYTISPAGEICFGPKADVSYTAQGEYWKSNQTLAANADIPECPTDYHMAIVWRALQLLKIHDEDTVQTKKDIDGEHDRIMFQLRRNQLPTVRIGMGTAIA